MKKLILDACCGSRMFWFNKQREDTIYMDNRTIEDTLCDGRKLIVNPDIIADFKNMPFEDKSFKLIIFDPPHLISAGENSWLAKKYGKLDKNNWKNEISQGFIECWRVLDIYGTLIFKWNEEQIKLKDILKLFKISPLLGNKRAKTHWLVFFKDNND